MADIGSGRYRDLDRPGLDAVALVTALQRGGGLWRAVEVVEEIGSTNAALAAAPPTARPRGGAGREHRSPAGGGSTGPGPRPRGRA